jgi:2-dehydropantoate 2-reductase
VEIDFIARGENEKVIKAKGLTIESEEGVFVAHPKIVTVNPEAIGKSDYLICCIKSYDLEKNLGELAPLIGDNTIILPLLNGVDSYERIRKIFPHAKVWEGCVYIVSRLIAAGHIRQTGTAVSLHFGDDNAHSLESTRLLKIFSDAGIDAKLSDNIRQTIWEKFLFISPLATLTCYLNQSIGPILENKESEKLLEDLITELYALAKARGINLTPGMVTAALRRMAALPYDATSSMHDDLQKNKNIEVESLTGYVVKLGRELNVPTPIYQKLYETLIKIVHSS